MTRTVPLLACALLISAGCGSTEMSEQAASTGVEVAVRTFSFVPRTVRVDAGTSITWTNEDKVLHTITSGTQKEQGVPGVSETVPARPDGVFHEPLDGAGSTASVTLSEPGTYAYYCAIHAGMVGEIVVR